MNKSRQSANLVSDSNIFVDITNDRVGVGTTNPRFKLEVGAVGSSGTSLHVNGDVRITGILTVGTSTLTLDGQNNKIIVGSGVTIDGNTGIISATAFYAGGSIVSGGGGGTQITIYDDQVIVEYDGWTKNTTYSSCMRTAGGNKGNSFFFVRMENNTTLTDTRLRIYPFSVNRSTGSIVGFATTTASNIWLNEGASAVSTQYYTGPSGTGAVFIGGNYAGPNETTNRFSYTKFIVNSDGSASDIEYKFTGADHGYNGFYYSLPTGISTGYFLSSGYDSFNSNRAMCRINYMNGTSIGIGTTVSLGSDTSTSYSVTMISQPGVYQTGNQVCNFIYFRTNSTTYFVRAVSASGDFADTPVDTWDSTAQAFQMTNGDVVLYSDLHVPMRFTAYNSKVDMTSASPYTFANVQWSFHFIGLGNNEFVVSLNPTSPFIFGSPLVKATLDATTGFTVTGLTTPDYNVSLGMDSNFTGMYPLYANENDELPDKLLVTRQINNLIRAKVIDFPTFAAV